MLEKNCHIFNWLLRYTIPSELIEELLERIDYYFTHIKHLINSNIEVGTPPPSSQVHPVPHTSYPTFQQELDQKSSQKSPSSTHN